MVERRDLLMESDTQKVIDKEKLAKDLDEGMALVNMMETRGWKLLYEGFIKPNIEELRFLEAPQEQLAEVRTEMRILKRLMKFIEVRIDAANKVASKIKK